MDIQLTIGLPSDMEMVASILTFSCDSSLRPKKIKLSRICRYANPTWILENAINRAVFTLKGSWWGEIGYPWASPQGLRIYQPRFPSQEYSVKDYTASFAPQDPTVKIPQQWFLRNEVLTIVPQPRLLPRCLNHDRIKSDWGCALESF